MKRRYISKAELAMAYRPDITPKSAKRVLIKQLNNTPGLMEALLATGYNKKQRIFNPKQIEIIYSKIGAP